MTNQVIAIYEVLSKFLATDIIKYIVIPYVIKARPLPFSNKTFQRKNVCLNELKTMMRLKRIHLNRFHSRSPSRFTSNELSMLTIFHYHRSFPTDDFFDHVFHTMRCRLFDLSALRTHIEEMKLR